MVEGTVKQKDSPGGLLQSLGRRELNTIPGGAAVALPHVAPVVARDTTSSPETGCKRAWSA